MGVMQQAFLITAYKDEKQLFRLLDNVTSIGKAYVHIDTKSKELDAEAVRTKASKRYGDKATIFSQYKIYWGGFDHILAILYLMKQALKDDDNAYFHIISGQDYPVRSASEFEKYFSDNDHIYMSCTSEGDFPEEVKDRCRKYRIIGNENPNNIFVKALNRTGTKICSVIGKEPGVFNENLRPNKGMIWSSMPRTAAEYILDYISEHPDFLKKLCHIRLAEEFIFQTILMNSNFAEHVVKDNLRYTDWENAIGGSPAVLDKSHYEKIESSEAFFMRKVSSEISDGLVEKIEHNERKD